MNSSVYYSFLLIPIFSWWDVLGVFPFLSSSFLMEQLHTVDDVGGTQGLLQRPRIQSARILGSKENTASSSLQAWWVLETISTLWDCCWCEGVKRKGATQHNLRRPCINLGSRHHHTPSMRVSDTLHAEGMARKLPQWLGMMLGEKPSESLNHKPSWICSPNLCCVS